MDRYQVTKAKPYSTLAMMQQPYNIQNMLVAQANFPLYVYSSDDRYQVWEDRLQPQEYSKIVVEVTGRGPAALSYNQSLSFDQTKEICERVISLTSTCKLTFDGCRIVRHTNVASGFPCCTFEGIIFNTSKDRKTYSSNTDAPNIEEWDGNLTNCRFFF